MLLFAVLFVGLVLVALAPNLVYYCDLINGNDANNGTSFAQRVQTINKGTTLMAPGDTLRVMGSPQPTSLGQIATWTGLTPASPIVLTMPVTQTITLCEGNWTASANVTCTLDNADFKEGANSEQIAIGAGFTTGLAAFFATGALNLATYQQVTFWLKQTAGNLIGAGNLSLRLCSDTAGVTTVNTIALPNITAGALNQWMPVTVDLGGALSSGINSIALYVDVNNGAQTIKLDCILAALSSSSPNSLTLTSLIGHQDSVGAGGLNYDTWYGIASIVGTTIRLDQSTAALPSAQRGWSGRAQSILSSTNASPISINSPGHGLVTGDVITVACHPINTNANGSQTVTVTDANNFTLNGTTGNGVGPAAGGFYVTSILRTTWKRETTKPGLAATTTTDIQSVGASGTAGNLLNISGGWDTISMSSQVGETWIDGQTNFGRCLDLQSFDYLTISRLSFVRARFAISTTGGQHFCSYSGIGASNLFSGIPLGLGGFNSTVVSVTAVVNSGGLGSLGLSTSASIGLFANNTGNWTGATVGSLNITTVANNAPPSGGIITVWNGSNFTCTGIYGNKTNSGSFSLTALSFSRAIVGFVANNNNVIPDVQLNIGSLVSTCAGRTGGGSAFAQTVFPAIGVSYLVNSFSVDSTAPTVGPFSTAFSATTVISFNDAFSGKTVEFTDGGQIANDSATVHTPGGLSWKFSPQSTNRSSTYPLESVLARLTVVAGTIYTISAWVQLSLTNTTLSGRLLLRGGQLLGVPSDLTSPTLTAPAGSWQQLTLPPFTPTQSGVVEIVGQAWDGTGTTGNVWFDDLVVTNGGQTRIVTLDYADPRFGPATDPLVQGPAFEAGGVTWTYPNPAPVTKNQDENEPYTMDMSAHPLIAAGATIIGATFSLEPGTDNGLLLGSVAWTLAKAQVRLSVGTRSVLYNVHGKFNLSDGSTISMVGPVSMTNA